MTPKPAGRPRASGRSGARGSYAVGDERRARILDTAVEHFSQWGFHASSMARIAGDVGITQGGLLHHFRSKEDLLVSVLRRSDERDVERFFSVPFDTAVGACEALLRLAEFNVERPGRTRMFNVLAGESGEPAHPAHEFFEQRYRMVIGNIGDAFERGIASGELRPDIDCEAEARQLAAVMDGLQLQWAIDPSRVDMVTLFRHFLDRILRAITVNGTGLPES